VVKSLDARLSVVTLVDLKKKTYRLLNALDKTRMTKWKVEAFQQILHDFDVATALRLFEWNITPWL
jgi:hypothetical protein